VETCLRRNQKKKKKKKRKEKTDETREERRIRWTPLSSSLSFWIEKEAGDRPNGKRRIKRAAPSSKQF
jgi:hypothetical protein